MRAHSVPNGTFTAGRAAVLAGAAARLCGSGGLRHCGPALDAALASAYRALVKANKGSAN